MLGNLCRIFLGVSNLFWESPILPPTDLVGGFLLFNWLYHLSRRKYL